MLRCAYRLFLLAVIAWHAKLVDLHANTTALPVSIEGFAEVYIGACSASFLRAARKQSSVNEGIQVRVAKAVLLVLGSSHPLADCSEL